MSFQTGLMRRVLLGGAAVAAMAAGPAFAAEDENTLTEVVVTAERTEQNLQKVPIAATVLSGDQLAERSVQRIADLQTVSPSLAINTVNRSTFINIRGIGIAQSAPTSTPGVAVYLNGGLIPHEFAIAYAFYDLASVEVLRGPQGTLTGQNSTGGAIYFRTPAPEFDNANGYIDAQVGNYDWRRVIVAGNLPINDQLALRVATVREKRDSFYTNLGTPKSQPGNLDFRAIRGDLRWKPSDALDTDLRLEYFSSDTDANAVKNRRDRVSPEPFTIEEDALSNALVEGYRADIEVKWDFVEGVRLRWHSSTQQTDVVDISDGDRTATALPQPPATNTGRLAYGSTKVSSGIHEVDLISTGQGNFDWVIGAFYLEEDIPVYLARFNFDTVIRSRAPNNITQTFAENISKSVFGQATWRFAPDFSLIAGGRYSKDKQAYARILPAGVTGVAKSSEPTGKVALNWQATPQTLVYGSVSRGYKAGGVNLVVGDAAFGPEKNVVEELGVKTTVMDGHLRLNGAVFASQYKDMQVSSLTPARLPTTLNLPKARFRGFEAEAQGVFGDLRLSGGLSYLHGETSVDALLLNNTVAPSVLLTVPDGSGMPFTPKWSVNAAAEYDLHVGDLLITPRVQWSHIETQYASFFRNAASLVPDRDIIDLRLSVSTGKAWQVEGFVMNLTDNTYVASQIFDASSNDGGTIYGAPRQYGVRLKVKFD